MAKKTSGLVRELPCKLSPQQVNERGPLLSKKEIELETQLGAARAKAAEYRVKVKDIRKDITRISKEIDTGHEMREVSVYEKPGLANGAIDVFRADTGELIETITNDPERAAAVRQGGLFDKTAGKKLATTPARKGDRGKAGKGEDDEHPDATAARTGKGGVFIGDDDQEYKLTAEQADAFRAGKGVSVPGKKKGTTVEIMRPKKPAKSNGVEASP